MIHARFTIFPTLIFKLTQLKFLLVAAVASLTAFPIGGSAQSAGKQIIFPETLEWTRQKAVDRYRLQIAADEKFANVYLDRRVFGNHYTVVDLAPGYYYWRVASADERTGSFSVPRKFFISGGVITTVALPNRIPAAATIRPRSH